MVVRAPWQVTAVVVALLAANALLKRKSTQPPLDREALAAQERNAAHPHLLRAATFGVGLSIALLFTTFIFSFVMFMNAREQTARESEGNYRPTTFQVLQVYWQPGKVGTSAGGHRGPRVAARGLVEGTEEFMDLQPFLGFFPKDQAALELGVPVNTLIDVYYDPTLLGDYRVIVRRNSRPGVASRLAMEKVARYGGLALLLLLLFLLGFLRLRKFALAAA